MNCIHAAEMRAIVQSVGGARAWISFEAISCVHSNPPANGASNTPQSISVFSRARAVATTSTMEAFVPILTIGVGAIALLLEFPAIGPGWERQQYRFAPQAQLACPGESVTVSPPITIAPRHRRLISRLALRVGVAGEQASFRDWEPTQQQCPMGWRRAAPTRTV